MYYLILIIVVGMLGSFSSIYAEDYTVSIPFGAYNPELNTPTEYGMIHQSYLLTLEIL